MLTVVAALIVVLGLSVSLARKVRGDSAERLTVGLLRQLNILMSQYTARHDGQLPLVQPLIESIGDDEPNLQDRARTNNMQFVRALRSQQDLSQGIFAGLPLSLFDNITLRDAWGSPIVFMPAMDPAIGMAPRDNFFFVSAGPDRRYLTKEDNVYSYEGASE